jgi:prevent-host-death family protein
MYSRLVEVGVAAFRADLKRWLDLVRSGEEVVVTERGVPVAKLTPVEEADVIERLIREGKLERAKEPKTSARGRRRVKAKGSISDLVVEMRRGPDER